MRRSFVTASRILLVIALVLVTYFSLTPTPPGGAFGNDKLAHLGSYVVLAFLMVMSFRVSANVFVSGSGLTILLVVYGALIESLQPYTGRSFDPLDMGMNALGAAAGAALGLAVRHLIARAEHRAE